VADGGTGLSSYAVGDLLYASAGTTLAGLADVAVGSYLASGGVTTAPSWATLNQAAVAGLTTADGPTFHHLHLTYSAFVDTLEAVSNVVAGQQLRLDSINDYQELYLNKTDVVSSVREWILGRRNDTYFGTDNHGIILFGIYRDGTGAVDHYVGGLFVNPDGTVVLAPGTHLTSGNVGVGDDNPAEKLDVDGNINVTGVYKVDDGQVLSELAVSVPEVKTDTTTPTDLTITTGAAKTLVLATVVYQDINIDGYLLAKPASSAPGVDTFRSTGGTDTTIETYAFAIDEKVHGGFELQHDYKEGTDLVFHVHWQGIAAPAGGTDNVQWRLNYIVSRDGVTLAAATVIDSPDVAIDTQYRCYRTDFGAITGTNFKIGDQFMFTLTRVAAVSDDYAGDCLIETVGIHYQIDTLGSRTIVAK